MCLMKKQSNPLATIDSKQATEQASLEARLRRRRAGVQANVLTGPNGITNTNLGQAA